MSEALLTPAEVAGRCKVSTKTVMRAIRAGRLRASRLGERGAYRLRVADVDAWLDATALDVPRLSAMAHTEGARPPITLANGGRLLIGERMGRRP